jgi:hypothetical protein
VPVASASHHVVQVTTGPEKLTSLARMRPAIATAELISAVGTKAISANLAAPRAVAKVSRPFDQWCSSHAPALAASGVPMATAADRNSELLGLRAAAKNAPTVIAGQMR